MRKSASHHSTGKKKSAGTAPSALPDGSGASAGESQIVLYRTLDGGAPVEVRLLRESVWLTQGQMADLFEKDTDTVGLHIRNVFDENELEEAATTEESSVVQKEGRRSVRRTVRIYNLDVIISVRYRVRSHRGTQFRIWATSVLRDHILKGYSVNERRLKELNQAVRLIAGVAERRELSGDEATALLRVAADYSFALDLLDEYDRQDVTVRGTAREKVEPLQYEEALRLVARLREKLGAPELFGREKDKGLKGALGAVMQTFGGRDVFRVWKRRQPICCTFSSRTTHSWTATSASALRSSSGSWRRTGLCIGPTVASAFPAAPSLR